MKLLPALHGRFVEIAGVVSLLSLVVAYFYIPERLTPEERLTRNLRKARLVLLTSPDYAYDLLNESPNVNSPLQREKDRVMRMAEILSIKEISEEHSRLSSLAEGFVMDYSDDHREMHGKLADQDLKNFDEIWAEHRGAHEVFRHAASLLMKGGQFDLAESLARKTIFAGVEDDQVYTILCDVHSLIGLTAPHTPEESYAAAIENARKIRDHDLQWEFEIKVNSRFAKHGNVVQLYQALKKADNVNVLARVSHIAAGSSIALGRPEDAIVTSWLLFNILKKINPADRAAYLKNATASYVMSLRSAGQQIPEQMYGAIRGLDGSPAIAAGLYELDANPSGGLYLLGVELPAFNLLPVIEFGISQDEIFRRILRYSQKTNDAGEVRQLREIWSRLCSLQPVNNRFVLGLADLYAAEARIYLVRNQMPKYEEAMARGGYYLLGQLDRLVEIRDAERSAYLRIGAELLARGNCIVRAAQTYRLVYDQDRKDVLPMAEAVSIFQKFGIVDGESALEFYGLGAAQYALRDVESTSALLVDIALMRAKLFRMVGELTKAVDAYEEIRDDSRFNVSPLAYSLYFTGTIPWAESLLEEAEVMWEQYRRHQVKNADDHLRKIGTLLDEYKERYVMHPDARVHSIQSDRCFALLARLNVENNDFKEAIQNLDYSTKLKPMPWEEADRWRAHYMLAALYFRDGRLSDAYNSATKAIGMTPESQRWCGFQLRAKINGALQNSFEARLDSEKADEEYKRSRQ